MRTIEEVRKFVVQVADAYQKEYGSCCAYLKTGEKASDDIECERARVSRDTAQMILRIIDGGNG